MKEEFRIPVYRFLWDNGVEYRCLFFMTSSVDRDTAIIVPIDDDFPRISRYDDARLWCNQEKHYEYDWCEHDYDGDGYGLAHIPYSAFIDEGPYVGVHEINFNTNTKVLGE